MTTDNAITSSPLYWPPGRPRARYRQRAAFKISLGRARDHLLNEIRMLRGKGVILSTNLELRLDGLPYANQKHPDDSGVAVYFTYKGSQHCFACDDWRLVEDNMRAIGKTIEALRGIARWGTGDMIERAFQGFKQLPAPESEPWWSVLGFSSESVALGHDWERDAKRLMQKYHPDRENGDESRFKQISAARTKGREVQAQ